MRCSRFSVFAYKDEIGSHIYQAADLVLLDDVLGAVDAQVASWIISNAILNSKWTNTQQVMFNSSSLTNGVKFLRLQWRKIENLSCQVGVAKNIFIKLFGDDKAGNTFWLDSSSTEKIKPRAEVYAEEFSKRMTYDVCGEKGSHDSETLVLEPWLPFSPYTPHVLESWLPFSPHKPHVLLENSSAYTSAIGFILEKNITDLELHLYHCIIVLNPMHHTLISTTSLLPKDAIDAGKLLNRINTGSVYLFHDEVHAALGVPVASERLAFPQSTIYNWSCSHFSKPLLTGTDDADEVTAKNNERDKVALQHITKCQHFNLHNPIARWDTKFKTGAKTTLLQPSSPIVVAADEGECKRVGTLSTAQSYFYYFGLLSWGSN
ncbi:hypothetical protein Tco_0878094 [Tanacetum coccineum]|uniref:Aminotransferase class I/classII domain-containing protein n=1 Tax=Tanacetum coccineum TaxID=301880 RepID=A0ABQ5BYJ6_9ASTR